MYLIIIQVELKSLVALFWVFSWGKDQFIDLARRLPYWGVIAGDRLAEVVETFSHIRQPWSPNNGGNTGRARIWCQESTFPWNTLGPLMYRVSWWIPFGYLFTMCGVLCFLVFTAMHWWLRKQWWVGASIWSRAPNTKRWHTRPTRVAHTQVCFVHRETI